MNFLVWYGIGLIILFVLFAQQAYMDYRSIKKAANDLYDTFIRRGGALSTGVLLVAALFGPLLLPMIAYFKFRTWQNSLAVDDEGKLDYPWRKE